LVGSCYFVWIRECPICTDLSLASGAVGKTWVYTVRVKGHINYKTPLQKDARFVENQRHAFLIMCNKDIVRKLLVCHRVQTIRHTVIMQL
jgi:hypothetical protein